VLADVDGDDVPEIFVVDRLGRAAALDRFGAALPGWPVTIDRYEFTPPSPAVADLDGDGSPEILFPGGESVWALRADGTHFPGFPRELGAEATGSPVVADLDGDGALDVLQGAADRRLHALALAGGEVPGWPRRFRETPSSTPFVADVDGDGDLDVAVGADDFRVHLLDVPGPAAPGAAPWPGYHGGESLDGVWRAPSIPVDVVAPPASPVALSLAPAAPNPFRAATELRFSLPRSERVSLEIFDVTGRRVARPVAGELLPAGPHGVLWDGRDAAGRAVASGVYFLRLSAGRELRTAKLLRVR
jgi:hypothetical protein